MIGKPVIIQNKGLGRTNVIMCNCDIIFLFSTLKLKMLQHAMTIEDKEEDYPLRSLQLLGVKILAYFVSMMSPRKHVTNT